jgi:squalene-associated FAD-dependent desaturase
MRVAIVGGGLSGLAAGTALREAGHEVDLFERSRLLGGRATSFEIDGVEVDNGQHVFLACCEAFIDFVRRTGMGDRLFLQERFEAIVIEKGKAAVLRAGNARAPWHLLPSFARFGHLGVRGKLDVARALVAASRDGAAPLGETFGDWLARRHQSAQAIRVFWEPFFVPALNVPLDQMDANEALFTLRTAFLKDAGAARFGYATVPLAHIAEAAANKLAKVNLSTSVQFLEFAGTRASALVTTAGDRHAYDAFILALTPPQLLRLLGEPERYGINGLAQYKPHPIIDVHLRYTCHPERSEHGSASVVEGRIAGAGFTFAALIDSPIQWVFRKGEGYVVCSMSAADAYARSSTDELIAIAWRELQQAMPQLKEATLQKGAVTRNPEATFSAPAKVVRPGPATAIENLCLAGSWTGTGWPDTMESAVRSGIAAAHRIMETMEAG